MRNETQRSGSASRRHLEACCQDGLFFGSAPHVSSNRRRNHDSPSSSSVSALSEGGGDAASINSSVSSDSSIGSKRAILPLFFVLTAFDLRISFSVIVLQSKKRRNVERAQASIMIHLLSGSLNKMYAEAQRNCVQQL